MSAEPPIHGASIERLHVFTIWGMPRTKKTSDEIGYPKGQFTKFPSRTWRDWVKTARFEWTSPRPQRPLTMRVSCRAHFYLTPRQGGDPVGYYQGLADFLEQRGIPWIKEMGLLQNDRLIADWDGSRGPWHSRSFIDRAHPRIEIVLTELPPRMD